jgi:hypothetical protein
MTKRIGFRTVMGHGYVIGTWRTGMMSDAEIRLSELLDSFNSEEEWLAYRESYPLIPISSNDDVPWNYDMKIF